MHGVTRGDVEEPPGSATSSLVSPDIHAILYHASLAPSGHNAQPWSVRLAERALWIGTEPSRWLPKVDPTNREVALSLGAFVENLVVAAPAYGQVADCDDVAPSTAGDLVRIRLTQSARRNAPLERIRARRTLRSGHESREISSADVEALRSCAGIARAHFFTAASTEGRRVAEATLEANRVQTARDDAQAELAEWMRWTPAEGRAHRNGFTPESLEITGIAAWYVRHFMNRQAVLGRRFRKQSMDRVRRQLARCGGWFVITSEDGSVPALIDAGRRCERMWLQARERSIAIHPMSQVLEESPFKDEIARDLGVSGGVQFLLRAGYVSTYPDPVSLRMPVSWFLKA